MFVPGRCPLPSRGMGSFLQACLPPWLPSDPGLCETALLVAHLGSGHLRVCLPPAPSVLRTRLLYKLRLASFNLSLSLTVIWSHISLVSLHLMATPLTTQLWTGFPTPPTSFTSQATFCQGDGPAHGAVRLPDPWTSGGHGFRPWSSVLVPVLEGGLHTHWVVGQPVFRVSSPIHSQSELANQDLETALWCLVSANPTTWSQQLVWVEYTRNTLRCAATGFSPFY